MPRAKRPRPQKPNARGATRVDTEIGGRIRAMRMDKRMSQQELGRMLNLTFQQIQKYERGSNRISLSRALEIAAIFKIGVDKLAGDGAPAIDGFTFDAEAYKLARVFVRLPDRLKAKFRNLIESIVEE